MKFFLQTPPPKRPKLGIGKSPVHTSRYPSAGRETLKDVLRSMNLHLKGVLETKEIILKNWREELQAHKEFQKNELKLFREEF